MDKACPFSQAGVVASILRSSPEPLRCVMGDGGGSRSVLLRAGPQVSRLPHLPTNTVDPCCTCDNEEKMLLWRHPGDEALLRTAAESCQHMTELAKHGLDCHPSLPRVFVQCGN